MSRPEHEDTFTEKPSLGPARLCRPRALSPIRGRSSGKVGDLCFYV